MRPWRLPDGAQGIEIGGNRATDSKRQSVNQQPRQTPTMFFAAKPVGLVRAWVDSQHRRAVANKMKPTTHNHNPLFRGQCFGGRVPGGNGAPGSRSAIGGAWATAVEVPDFLPQRAVRHCLQYICWTGLPSALFLAWTTNITGPSRLTTSPFPFLTVQHGRVIWQRCDEEEHVLVDDIMTSDSPDDVRIMLYKRTPTRPMRPGLSKKTLIQTNTSELRDCYDIEQELSKSDELTRTISSIQTGLTCSPLTKVGYCLSNSDWMGHAIELLKPNKKATRTKMTMHVNPRGLRVPEDMDAMPRHAYQTRPNTPPREPSASPLACIITIHCIEDTFTRHARTKPGEFMTGESLGKASVADDLYKMWRRLPPVVHPTWMLQLPSFAPVPASLPWALVASPFESHPAPNPASTDSTLHYLSVLMSCMNFLFDTKFGTSTHTPYSHSINAILNDRLLYFTERLWERNMSLGTSWGIMALGAVWFMWQLHQAKQTQVRRLMSVAEDFLSTWEQFTDWGWVMGLNASEIFRH
ncbi:hypothetical protein ACRALDRAFT_205661 [Sodiomyces alcalophilus JCM 7366]|uniref:uncharacterized protein n=1 Tax=Sodiomyces alcalophilus JCM 7366 TaxID=591952 RepID=UPI0039B56EEC